MKVINLTPHSIEVYHASQFVNLEQVNSTTWIADEVQGDPIVTYPSEGEARIAVTTSPILSELPGETVTTVYGEATGIPEIDCNTTLIVSCPMRRMAKETNHPLSGAMVSPYKVVRSRSNGSLVLGCMGSTY